MKRNSVRILSIVLALTLLISALTLYVSAENTQKETHTILTWHQDGTVVTERYDRFSSRTSNSRIKEAFSPEHTVGISEPSRGLVSSQVEVNAHISPYCAIGYIESWFDENGDGIAETLATGTGFLEAEDIMVTAAHVVYNNELNI